MTEQTTIVDREAPEPADARRELVSAWAKRIEAAKQYWSGTFNKMRANQRFVAGKQWPDGDMAPTLGAEDTRYVANITLRHVLQRTAALYAKNPKMVARLRKRLYSTVWDGSMQQLQTAQGTMTTALQAPAAVPPDALAQAQAVVQDAAQAYQQRQQVMKLGKTLEIVYEHQIDEQVHPFKTMMKAQVVRRAVTCGVGIVKLGFQRAMQHKPEIERQLADVRGQLAKIERLSADLADGEAQPESKEAEELRLMLQGLEKEEQVLVREGLTFDFPSATALIVDPKCTYLREFIGADFVAEEFPLTPEQVQEVYGVDVGKSYTRYERLSPDNKNDLEPYFKAAMGAAGGDPASQDDAPGGYALVWEIYCKRDGLVYVVCDGHPDFLVEPAPPDVYIERFYPFFIFAPNECDDEGTIYPPSDVDLIRDAQLELNRARQGLREHRHAARPKTAVAAGRLSDEDKDKLEHHPANAVIELSGLAPGEKIEDLLQAFRGPGIDPNLYEVNPVFQDVQRVLNVQEANLGGTGGATATESSIAESSRMSSTASAIDELDDLLSQLARAGGQILLAEMSPATVTEIAGPGAFWPELSRDKLAQEVFLEIAAGSTGRPNQSQEIQNAERIYPLLMQIPGISPDWMGKDLIQRLDDRLPIEDAFAQGMASVVAMNAMKNIAATGSPVGGAQGATTTGNVPGPPERSNAGPPRQTPAPPPGG